jgi:hypothetical protein
MVKGGWRERDRERKIERIKDKCGVEEGRENVRRMLQISEVWDSINNRQLYRNG